MKLLDFVVREAILVDLQATGKEEAIREMVGSLNLAGRLGEDEVARGGGSGDGPPARRPGTAGQRSPGSAVRPGTGSRSDPPRGLGPSEPSASGSRWIELLRIVADPRSATPARHEDAHRRTRMRFR